MAIKGIEDTTDTNKKEDSSVNSNQAKDSNKTKSKKSDPSSKSKNSNKSKSKQSNTSNKSTNSKKSDSKQPNTSSKAKNTNKSKSMQSNTSDKSADSNKPGSKVSKKATKSNQVTPNQSSISDKSKGSNKVKAETLSIPNDSKKSNKANSKKSSDSNKSENPSQTKAEKSSVSDKSKNHEDVNSGETNSISTVNSYKVPKKPSSIFRLVLEILVTILVVFFLIFTAYNSFNQNILSGITIKNVDVSKMSASDAKMKIDDYIEQNLPEEITVKHGEFQATISLSQINARFNTKAAADDAYNIGRTGSFLDNNLFVFSSLFGSGSVNIEPQVQIDTAQLTKNLEDMSPQLPDKVSQSSYYIDDGNLIITSGVERICS